jgi:hypothetical protein
MIKWTITYNTYNGDSITEDFYFNLNKAELIQMQFDVNGAYSQFIERIMNERDLKTIGDQFRKIILSSYGKKSDDGKQFRKSPEILAEFEQSEAYPTLYIELLEDADKMAKFVRGILPKDLQASADVNKLPFKSV